MSTVALAQHSAYAGYAWLAPLLSKKCLVNKPTNLLGLDANHKGCYEVWANLGLAQKIYWNYILRESENVIYFGVSAISFAQKILRCTNPLEKKKNSVVIISDSIFFKQLKFFLDLFYGNNVYIFIMPDMMHLVPDSLNPVPFYQYVEIPRAIHEGKSKILSVAHSPGSKRHSDLKGTSRIEAACRKIGVPLDVISGMPQEESVKAKARSQLFVDQCLNTNQFNYSGGLGKSGIEAMHVRCAVLTSGGIPDTRGFFPPPPIIPVTPTTIESEIRKLLDSTFLIEEVQEKQVEWARTYTNREFVVEHIKSRLDFIN